MASFLGMPKVQFFDNNGNALSGGKLYTYEPGTTTNKASYPTLADAVAGTNANANPVILDSRGEANVVLVGNTKLKLDDSSDNNIWTVDNVNEDATILDTNGNEMLVFTTVASAVNHIGLVNASTGNSPKIQAEGEADTGIILSNKDGEEILILDSIASSVNEFTISSAATGNGPILQATGDDDNIDINITPKGTGIVTVNGGTLTLAGTSSAASAILLSEDTDNGTNTIGFIAPAALTASTTFILPDGDGTNTQVLQTNGSGTLSWTDAPSQAVQADVEAETNENTYVPPDLLRHNPGIAKGWGYLGGTGTVSILANYNVDSIVDDGTGNYTVVWSTDFSSNTYCAVTSVTTLVGSGFSATTDSLAGGQIGIVVRDDSGTLSDQDFMVAALGDQ